MSVGALELDPLLGDVHPRPVVAALRRTVVVGVAEVGHHDPHRRARLGVAVVSADSAHLHQVLGSGERLVAARPELALLSDRRRVLGPEDPPHPQPTPARREDTGRHG